PPGCSLHARRGPGESGSPRSLFPSFRFVSPSRAPFPFWSFGSNRRPSAIFADDRSRLWLLQNSSCAPPLVTVYKTSLGRNRAAESVNCPKPADRGSPEPQRIEKSPRMIHVQFHPKLNRREKRPHRWPAAISLF